MYNLWFKYISKVDEDLEKECTRRTPDKKLVAKLLSKLSKNSDKMLAKLETMKDDK